MLIDQDEYERLKNAEALNKELEAETKRLAELISSKTKNCKVGPWCKDCAHVGYDRAEAVTGWDQFIGAYTRVIGGNVTYCKKHLHEICPEFEQK